MIKIIGTDRSVFATPDKSSRTKPMKHAIPALVIAAAMALALPAYAQNVDFSSMFGGPSPPAPPNYRAPKQADSKSGLPDWSGVWFPHEGPLFDPTAFDQPGNKGKEAHDIRQYPPYNAEWEAKYVKKLEENKQGVPTDPVASCLPGGMPRVVSAPFPLEFVIQPRRVTILSEAEQARRIYADGSNHPSADELDPSYMGHSIGHWEGDTLVVDTVGIRSESVYDVTAAPHSDKVHVVERIRRISPTQIENVLTIHDPVAFTKPWVVKRRYDLKPDWRINEYVCQDNNRNPIKDDGSTDFIAPGQPKH